MAPAITIPTQPANIFDLVTFFLYSVRTRNFSKKLENFKRDAKSLLADARSWAASFRRSMQPVPDTSSAGRRSGEEKHWRMQMCAVRRSQHRVFSAR